LRLSAAPRLFRRVRLNVLEPLIADFGERSRGASPAGRIVSAAIRRLAPLRQAWSEALSRGVARVLLQRRRRSWSHFGATAAPEWLLVHANATIRGVVMHQIWY
jgi:hypothetical protein